MVRHDAIGRLSVASSLALLGALSPSLAAAQSASVHALLKAGDTLQNGETVLSVLDHDIGATGRWAAIVGTTGVHPFRRSLVSSGAIVMTEGETTAGGEIVATLQDVAVSRDGTLGVIYDVENAADPGHPLVRLRLGSQVVLAEGDALSFGGLAPQDEVWSLSGFDFDGLHLIVGVRTESSLGTVKRAIVKGRLGTNGFTPTDAIVDGEVVTDLTWPFHSSLGDLDIADTGMSGAAVNLIDGGAIRRAAIFNDRGVVEEDAAGPAPNSTWSLVAPPRARVNRVGEYAVGGTLELSNGALRGVLYRGTQPVVTEGAGLNGVLGLTVGAFTTPAFELTDGGEVIFTVPFTVGSERLMSGTTTLLNTASDTLDGEAIASLHASLHSDSLSASHDGNSILLTVELAQTGPALLVVEREIAEATSCVPVANSTLGTGSLAATGSRYLQFDELTITATALPAHSFGYLLTSRSEGLVPNPGGSTGHLCLTGSIGRFIAQTGSSGATGTIATDVRPQSLPQPIGPVSAVHGETWAFQLWHRDTSMGVATSNFTNSISITFR